MLSTRLVIFSKHIFTEVHTYVLVIEIQVDYNYDHNFLDDGTETQPEEQICSPSTHPSQSYQDVIGESFPAQPSNHTQPNSGVTGESQCKLQINIYTKNNLKIALHQN